MYSKLVLNGGELRRWFKLWTIVPENRGVKLDNETKQNRILFKIKTELNLIT